MIFYARITIKRALTGHPISPIRCSLGQRPSSLNCRLTTSWTSTPIWAQTVAPYLPSKEQIAQCQWLTEAELDVYSTEFQRTGLQGGLQWYRCATSPKFNAELRLFAGLTINVPAMFISGKSDWGTYQKPGDYERMQTSACTQMQRSHLINGAGHWVQQEQPEAVSALLIDFIDTKLA